ncbi:hypothetical protein ALI144C_19105 [Actinosynnema sp. ALI-1.44]|nr:hypothetical protein ALI144C_19105 [Actinosynnema sp. ALI-1.44]
MVRIFHLVVIAFAWIGVVYKLSRMRRTFGQISLGLALVFFATALTVGLPPLYQRIPVFAAEPSLVRLVQHSTVVLAVFCVQMLVVDLTGRTRGKVWSRAVIAAVFLVTMVGLFIYAAPGDDAEDFVRAYASWPFVTEYLLTFLGCIAVALADISGLSLRFSGAAEKPLRLGLRLWATASFMGFAFAVHKAGFALATRLGSTPPWQEGPVSTALSGLTLVFLVAGLTAYSWGSKISEVRHRWRQRRTYRALLPLWREFYTVMPDLVLVPPDARGVPIDVRLYRCVIEILDGRLALRAYWDDEVARTARRQAIADGVTGDDLEAKVEAAALAAALDARRRGQPTGQGPRETPDLDVTEEIHRLVRVARVFSPRATAALPADVPG